MYIERIVVGKLAVNCYIVSKNEEAKEVFIVDPGDEAEEIQKMIGSRKLVAILLTHGHFDHTGALSAFPDTPIYISEKDAPLLQDSRLSCGSTYGDLRERPTATNLVREGDKLTLAGVHVDVIETPGHTMGSVCYIIGNTMLSGDTVFQRGYGRTDLVGGDFSLMKQSLRRIYAMKGMKILPGHGGEGYIS